MPNTEVPLTRLLDEAAIRPLRHSTLVVYGKLKQALRHF